MRVLSGEISTVSISTEIPRKAARELWENACRIRAILGKSQHYAAEAVADLYSLGTVGRVVKCATLSRAKS
jgi:hypothetical protein